MQQGSIAAPFSTGMAGAALFATTALAGLAQPAYAMEFTVTNTSDSGAGSLREAVTQAQAAGGGAHTIAFDGALQDQTITLSSALNVTGDITIDASGIDGLTISGDGDDRIFRIGGSSAGNVTLRDLEIVAGHAEGGHGGDGETGGGGGAGLGGAIYVDENGALRLDSVAFSDNTAQGGDGGSSGGDYDSSGGGGGMDASDGGDGGGYGTSGGHGGGPDGGGGGAPGGGDGAAGGDESGGGGGSFGVGEGGTGGDGGFGGGGGGGGGQAGVDTAPGGDGGFGGGGGAGGETFGGSGGAGGYGGGDGGGGRSGGGGGAGLGGAVFVRDGGSVTVIDSAFTETNQASGGSGGTGGRNGGTDGAGEGGALFLMGGGVLSYEVRDGNSVTLASDVASDGALGLSKTGNGTLVVGGDSRFDSGILIGEGTLVGTTRSLNGDITVNDTLRFDQDSDGSYSRVITGSGAVEKTGDGTLTLTGNSSYGGNTTVDGGTLRLEAGAQVSNGAGFIGLNSHSDGTVLVSGADADGNAATWTNDRALNVGYGGVGSLTIKDGGQVSSSHGYIGWGSNSEGTVIVSGTDADGNASTWTHQALHIGHDGTGALMIEDGGQVHSDWGDIGYQSGSEGSVVVSGTDADGNASAWTLSHDLVVGNAGTGRLTIEDGGQVANSGGFIGNYSDGAVIVSGADSAGNASTWTNNGNISIGVNGSGSLTIANGGNVRADSVTIAESGGTGTLNIGASAADDAVAAGMIETDTLAFGDGTATLNLNHTDHDYEFAVTLTSTGPGIHALDHQAGTTTLTGDSAGFDGTTTISGGTLRVGDAAGNGVLGGTVLVERGATLGGDGTVGTTVVDEGGVLAPGNSLGHLTVDGGLTLRQGSILDFEFGAPGADFSTPGESDSVTVNGDLALNGGTLAVTGNGDFGAGLYRLFDYSGNLTRLNGGLALAGDPTTLSLQFLDDQGQVNLLNTAGMTLNIWSGDNADGGDGVWSNGAASWTDVNGRVSAPMQPRRGFALFGNLGDGEGGNVTLNDGAGAIEATGLQFAGDGYALQGDALTLAGGDGEIRVGDGGGASTGYTATIATVIAGGDGVNKTGAGTLVLTGDNTYTGGTTLTGGVLSVADDSQLGDADGGLAFNGGVLRITDGGFLSTQRDLSWGAHGGGFDIAGANQRFSVNQDLAGAGDLVKRGQGLLRLHGDNDYGDTFVEAGRLFGNAASISGDLANAGEVVFAQDNDGTFAGNITGLDGTHGSLVKNGAGVLTLTGTSTLDWSVHEGELVTAAERFGGDLVLLADGHATFDQQQDGEYPGQLSGTGTLRKTGDGQLHLSGDNGAFGGTIQMAAGRLNVGGRLGGEMRVGNGGALGGDGTVGDTTLASGATLAPGNSIGTLTVDGDLVFESGSSYEVEVNPDNQESDLVRVTGSAALAGSVLHVGSDGDYRPFTGYTILSADGGILGEFDRVRSGFAFLDAGLDYGANTVRLQLTRNDITFDSAALSRNQHALAGAVETLAPEHAVYQDVVTREANTAPVAFDRYSGDALVAGLTASDRLIGRFGERLRQHNRAGHLPGEARTLAGDANNGLWLSTGAFDGEERRDPLTGNAAYEISGEQLTLGLDRALPRGHLGLAAGRAQGRLGFHRRADEGELDGWFLGAYGQHQLTDTLYARADLSYGEIDHDHERRFENGTRARSDSTVKALRAALETGFTLSAGRTEVRPYAQLAMIRLERDGFRESGAGDANLALADTSLRRGEATLGLNLGRRVQWIRLNADLAAIQPFGDTESEQTARFAGAGDAFTVYGADRDDPRLRARLGGAVALAPDVDLSLDYQIRADDQGNEQLGELGVSWRW